jgi:serine/threonine protein kinase
MSANDPGSTHCAFQAAPAQPASGPQASRPEPSIDRNLLFGILALQNDFINRDGLLAAFNTWVADKSRSLGQVLLERGVLSPNRHMLMEGLVEEHVKVHENDVQRSLTALCPIGELREDLSRIADSDLQASLPHVGGRPGPKNGDRAADRRSQRWARDFDAECAQELGPRGTILPTVGGSTTAGMRFRILRPHAKGGLGEVFVGHDTELNREVALKEIQKQYAFDPTFQARFEFEAEVTGGLEHPGIVPVYGLGHLSDGRPFYAMRFIQGNSLSDAIRRFHDSEEQPGRDRGQSALELRGLLGRFIDVCDAIAYAHSRGVLHRDLKPGNIMLGKYGETLVVDWGLAKTVDRPEPSSAAGRPELPLAPSSGSALEATLAGTMVGTPSYMSPEQAAGRMDQLGHRSDVYCLGATLYHLLTGHAPCETEEPGDLCRRVIAGDIPRPRALNPRIAPALEAVCAKAMALKLEGRYQSVTELKADVERWLADEPVEAHPERWADRVARWGRRHKAWTHAAAATLLAVTLIAIFSVLVMNQAWKQSELANTAKLVANAATLREAEQRRIAQKKAHNAELQKTQEKAARDLAEGRLVAEEAGVARAEHFHQKEAIDLARSLTISEQGDIRAQWLKAIQRSLVPVATSSRRFMVGQAAFSPDNRYLVTSEFLSGSIRVWRTEGWAQERVLTGHAVPDDSSGFPIVTALAFCPGSPSELISAGQDGTIRVWDVSTGRELRRSASETDKPAARIWSLGVSPILDSNGKRRLITGDSKGKLAFWELDSLRKLKEVEASASDLHSVRFSPNGRECASASKGSPLRIWGPEGNHVVDLAATGEKPDDELLGITDLAYSPDGRQLAAAGSSGRISIWDMAERKLLHTLAGDESGLTGVSGTV